MAAGDCMDSATYSYLVGKTTAWSIVSETCQASYVLHKDMLPSSLNEREWLQLANDFETQWDSPHRCGVIDGKHIRIQVISCS